MARWRWMVRCACLSASAALVACTGKDQPSTAPVQPVSAMPQQPATTPAPAPIPAAPAPVAVPAAPVASPVQAVVVPQPAAPEPLAAEPAVSVEPPASVVSVYAQAPLVQPAPVLVPWAPPPMLVQAPPPAPFVQAVWVGGYWVWHRRWIWSAGYWARPPRIGDVWTEPYYEHRHNEVIFVDGYWSAPGVVFVPPAPGLLLSVSAAIPGVVGVVAQGPQGVFVPAPPGSLPGLIVPAPLGTPPAVVVGAPAIVRDGMRVVHDGNVVVNNTTIHNVQVTNVRNVVVEAPASAVRDHRAWRQMAPAVAALAAAQAPHVGWLAPLPQTQQRYALAHQDAGMLPAPQRMLGVPAAADVQRAPQAEHLPLPAGQRAGTHPGPQQAAPQMPVQAAVAPQVHAPRPEAAMPPPQRRDAQPVPPVPVHEAPRERAVPHAVPPVMPQPARVAEPRVEPPRGEDMHARVQQHQPAPMVRAPEHAPVARPPQPATMPMAPQGQLPIVVQQPAPREMLRPEAPHGVRPEMPRPPVQHPVAPYPQMQRPEVQRPEVQRPQMQHEQGARPAPRPMPRREDERRDRP